jgi:hypothetical protein
VQNLDGRIVLRVDLLVSNVLDCFLFFWVKIRLLLKLASLLGVERTLNLMGFSYFYFFKLNFLAIFSYRRRIFLAFL